MGHGRYDDNAYKSYSNRNATMSTSQLFSRRSATDEAKSGERLQAEDIKFREARDSEDSPLSLPILFALDVTGSMGFIPTHLVKEAFGPLVNGLLQKSPVNDPHFLFMGIGDATVRDRYPLQLTQFEADNRILDQVTDLILEGGGGGNEFESYDLAWAAAAYLTKTDAWDKRKAKGYLFTIGDELFPKESSQTYFSRVFKDAGVQAPTPEQLLQDAQQRYHVFHIVVEEGSCVRRNGDRVLNDWRQRMDRRALPLRNHMHLPDLVSAVIAHHEGKAIDDVLAEYSEDVQDTLAHAFQLDSVQ